MVCIGGEGMYPRPAPLAPAPPAPDQVSHPDTCYSSGPTTSDRLTSFTTSQTSRNKRNIPTESDGNIFEILFLCKIVFVRNCVP